MRDKSPMTWSNWNAAGSGKSHGKDSMKPTNRCPRFATLTVSVALCVSSVQAKDTLQIDKAFLGAKDAWRDVTIFLQDQIDSDSLSLSIAQPFSSIGGDPAPGKGKNLIINYRVNGQPHRLWLEEKYPVAFEVKLPSPEAEEPGANPQVTALMENIASSPNLHSGRLGRYGDLLVYVAMCISLAALACAGLALFQLRQIRKVLTTPRVNRVGEAQ